MTYRVGIWACEAVPLTLVEEWTRDDWPNETQREKLRIRSMRFDVERYPVRHVVIIEEMVDECWTNPKALSG